MTPQERLRRRLAEQFAPALAEQMYQADKGSRYARLEHLPCDEARQIYYDRAFDALVGAAQQERMAAVNVALAHRQALLESAEHTARLQARADIHMHSKRTH